MDRAASLPVVPTRLPTNALALSGVILLGLALRVWAMLASYPASWNNWDTTAYLDAAKDGLFDNFFRPAGYPLFLRVLHDIWPEVGFTVGVQHLLGLAAAPLVYLMGRRLGLSRGLAVVPAAVIALNGDQIALEHAMLSESLFTPLLVASAYALVRAADSTRPWAWLAAAGAAAAAMVAVRAAALPLLAVMALGAALLPPVDLRGALRRAAVAGGVGIGLVLAYAAVAGVVTGHYGVTRGTGWAIYARAAPFADCQQFAPPKPTRRLCEFNDPEARPGPDFYLWEPGSPAWRSFGAPPTAGGDVGAFGRSALLHQPRTYVGYVLSDLWRYVNAGSGRTGHGFGLGPDLLLIDRRAPDVEQYTAGQVARWYGAEPLRIGSSLSTLADVQDAVRFHGALVLLSAVLILIAAVVGASRTRWAVLVLGALALVVMLTPAATMVYHARYGVPTDGLLALGGVLAAATILERVRRRGVDGTFRRPAS